MIFLYNRNKIGVNRSKKYVKVYFSTLAYLKPSGTMETNSKEN